MSKVEEIRIVHLQVLQELLGKVDDKHVDFKPRSPFFINQLVKG
ncbi:hypothetical protein [Sediminibacillus dalangtanensis]|nr:hypothetical protein [Sediminibacillus dalangtanensis]